MRILIVKLGSIGDIVHTLPALAALRAAMPQAEISWVVERRSSEILKDNPLLDRLIEVDTKALRRGLMSGETLRAPRQQLRRLRASAFDIALDFQGLLKSASIARLSGARRVFGYSRAGLREPASALLLSKASRRSEADIHVIRKALTASRRFGYSASEELSFPIQYRMTDEAVRLKRRRLEAGQLCDSESGRWLADKALERRSFGKLADRLWSSYGIRRW